MVALLVVLAAGLSGCATAPRGQDVPDDQGPSYWRVDAPRQTETDVWTRLSRQFDMPMPGHDAGRARVQHYVDFYLRNQNTVIISLERAEPWVEYLLAELERRNLPGELFLVPLVESSFAPGATSVSGAAGIWQFMPATGAHFGLRQTADFDGRRDVFASTHAALDYLELLHLRFDDWLLTLAAFNFGQGNVARAMEANQRRGARTDYWSLHLSDAAMSYVPRVLALRHIIEARRVPLPRHRPENTAVAVPVDAAIDLQRVAALTQVPLDDLRSLNPATRSTVLPAVPGARLALPRDAVPLLAQHHPNRRARGRDPIEAARATLVAQAGPQDQPAAVGTSAVAALNAHSRVHIVQPGESLWGIAAQHGVDLGELGEINGLARGSILSPGQQLRLPAASAAEAPVIVHRIEVGDTLFSISRLYGISLEALRQVNYIPGDLLRVGETLVIPRLR